LGRWGSVFDSANFANARCENIIKIDLRTRNFQQFLRAINQHYGMRCNSYSDGRRAAATIGAAVWPTLARVWRSINIAAQPLITFITAGRFAYTQYAVYAATV
jgi:hypothetical protein